MYENLKRDRNELFMLSSFLFLSKFYDLGKGSEEKIFSYLPALTQLLKNMGKYTEGQANVNIFPFNI